jgi:hypothetical protein
MRWQCGRCGDWHDALPFSYGSDPPVKQSILARVRPGRFGGELCRGGGSNFIYARVVLPLIEAKETFEWTVWVSLSDANFARTKKLWTTHGRESEPAYFGWFATELPPGIYPSTRNLKTHVITQPVGIRPLVELEPTDHPLAVEQRTGITMDRAREFAALLMHQ